MICSNIIQPCGFLSTVKSTLTSNAITGDADCEGYDVGDSFISCILGKGTPGISNVSLYQEEFGLTNNNITFTYNLQANALHPNQGMTLVVIVQYFNRNAK